MIVVGELINASRKLVREALENRNAEFLQDSAKKQVEAGAGVIDVNVGIGENEPSLMEWAVESIQKVIDKPLAIDTGDIEVLKAGLSVCRNPAWVNSISGEDERLNAFLPLIKEYDCNCIALTMDQRGILSSPEERTEVFEKILKEAENWGISQERIFFDPMVTPIATDINQALITLNTLSLIKDRNPDVRTVIAISNVSHGLPERSLLNRTFLVLALQKIDAVIANPLDEELMKAIKAGEALLAKDFWCRKYMKFFRNTQRRRRDV